MKKFLLFLLFALLLGASVSAFDILSYPPPLDGGGSVMIDAGLGISTYGWLYNWYGDLSVPPLFLNVEYALPVKVPISVGGFMAYYQYKYRWSGNYGWENNFLSFGARANWHWGFPVEWMDFYTGFWAGYLGHWYSNTYGTYTGSTYSYGGFDAGAQVGIHFYFTEVFGAVLETGYPFLIKAGVALKFGGNKGKGSASAPSQTPSKTQAARYALVNADTLNVRSGPSSDTSLVGQLARNTRVEVLDGSGTWWKIKSGNIEGYVNSSFLSEEK